MEDNAVDLAKKLEPIISKSVVGENLILITRALQVLTGTFAISTTHRLHPENIRDFLEAFEADQFEIINTVCENAKIEESK